MITNATQIAVEFQATGVWGTWYAVWDRQEYKRTGTADVTVEKDAFYDQQVDFCVPASTDYYKLTFNTITKEKIELVPQQSKEGAIRYLGDFTCNASDKRYAYQVDRPR